MSEPPATRYLGRGYQGKVFVESGGEGEAARPVVVKQPAGRGLVRRLRAWMLVREHAAYQRLGHIAGVPRCHGLRPDGSLVLSYIEAEPFRESAVSPDTRAAFFAGLHATILACHRAGVAHGDLKRRGNILVDGAGQPWVLDFGTAVLAGPRPGWLFRQVCRMDLNAWIKLKYQRRYDHIAPADAPFYQPTWLETLARVVRQTLRKLTGRTWRKVRRRRRQQGQQRD